MGGFSPEGHWYYEAKSSVILKDLKKNLQQPPKILDLGAGSGYFSRKIIDLFGGNANCVDINYSSEYKLDSITYSRTPVLSSYNVVLLLDVLEHVENPRELFEEVVTKAEQGCLIFVTVPAFMQLWSGHDEFLGHFKRFRLTEIRSLVEEVGSDLKVLRGRYLFSSLFPIVFLQRKLSKKKESYLKPANPILNQLLIIVCRIDHWFSRNSLFGVSAYLALKLVGKKR